MLTPRMQEKVDLFMARTHGVVRITEGYRSQERQNELYAQGRTKPGNIVTWTLTSNHTKGEAIDIAFTGTEPYPQDHKKWEMIARIANECGLDWGYDLWGIDKPHFQDNGEDLIKPMTKEQEKVQNRNEKFMNLLEISDTGLDLPITKRNVITIVSLVFESLTKKMLNMEKRLRKLENEKNSTV